MIAWLSQLLAIVRRRKEFESGLEDEFEFHLQSRADQLESPTVSRAEALRQARIEFGMLESHRDQVRRSRGLSWIDWLSADLRLAWRSLRKTPLYSLTAVTVLALPLATGLLLHALYAAYAVQSPNLDRVERWVHLYGDGNDDRRAARFISAEAELLVANSPSDLEGLYSARLINLPLVTDRVQRGIGVAVSANYFELTGIPALRGRVFASASSDDHGGVVLSERGWARLFDRDEDAIGQRVVIGGQSFSVLGIAGRHFRGTNEVGAHYWMLESDHRQHWPDPSMTLLSHEVSGFLKPPSRAESAASALAARVDSFNQQRDPDRQLRAIGVEAAIGYLRAEDRMVLRIAMMPVAILVLLMLVIAAANLTNLVLARFSARRHDVALRAALGASRGRMFAQLLTECGLIGFGAAAVALILLAAALQPLHGVLFSFMAELGLDPIEIGLNAESIALATGLAMLATVAFGALPAWLVTGAWSAHRDQATTQSALKGDRSSRLRSALMVTQLAASVFLVIVAAMVSGVAGKSQQTPLGYDPQRLVTLDGGEDPAAMAEVMHRSDLVREITATSSAPLMSDSKRLGVLANGQNQSVAVRHVDASWFQMLGLRPLRGRIFSTGEDTHNRAVVLSRSAANALWPDQDPLGKTLMLASETEAAAAEPLEVVGVVPDITTGFLIRGQEQPLIYRAARLGDPELSVLMMRLSDSSAPALARLYKRCIALQTQANCQPQLLTEALRIQQLPFQIASRIAAGLGWIAMGISCLGLYGLVAYSVVQRRRELGVRLALGARPARVVTEVMRTALAQIALGIALGLPLALGLTRLIAAITDLFDLVDLWAFVLTPLLLAIIATVAAWVPARRSATIAPSEALRHER
ncbi:MAG: ABC transporter permease [Xanthomonadales bacterium]|nr:ABC transporter permease [Xanthomonadales bacterium]